MFRALLIASLLLLPAPCLAQAGGGHKCNPAGAWYGGSVVAYQMTLVPAVPAGHYTVIFQGFYKNSVMSTLFTGDLVKKGKRYEGSVLGLSTQDPDFLSPPPVGKMPDLMVGWVSLEMLDCDTIRNTIPFFGLYVGAGIWAPGLLGPVWTDAKVPMVSPPDVDMIDVLSGGWPLIEVYRRLPERVNPELLH